MRRPGFLLICAAALGIASPVRASSPPDPSDGGSIVVEHRFGTTELAETPERIVSVDLQWTDALLAIGVTPVGYLASPEADESGIYPWEAGLLAESTPIEATDALPLEQI